MQHWILIDGYNLLYASGVTAKRGRTSLEGSRESLLDWLRKVLGEDQCKRTTIVFDARDAPPGLPDEETRHQLQVRFARRGLEADDLIEELILEHSSPRQLTVVSSDHRLHRAARRRKAMPIDSDQWVAEIRARSPRTSPNDPQDERQITPKEDELDFWLKEFRDDSP